MDIDIQFILLNVSIGAVIVSVLRSIQIVLKGGQGKNGSTIAVSIVNDFLAATAAGVLVETLVANEAQAHEHSANLQYEDPGYNILLSLHWVLHTLFSTLRILL